MKKHDFKKEWAISVRKHTRECRKKMFQEILDKGKVETLRDICSVFYGLSQKAKEYLVYNKIIDLARCGYTAQEIIDRLEVKK
jgi:hypothetical protein